MSIGAIELRNYFIALNLVGEPTLRGQDGWISRRVDLSTNKKLELWTEIIRRNNVERK